MPVVWLDKREGNENAKTKTKARAFDGVKWSQIVILRLHS